jgi:hypothetical protein
MPLKKCRRYLVQNYMMIREGDTCCDCSLKFCFNMPISLSCSRNLIDFLHPTSTPSDRSECLNYYSHGLCRHPPPKQVIRQLINIHHSRPHEIRQETSRAWSKYSMSTSLLKWSDSARPSSISNPSARGMPQGWPELHVRVGPGRTYLFTVYDPPLGHRHQEASVYQYLTNVLRCKAYPATRAGRLGYSLRGRAGLAMRYAGGPAWLFESPRPGSDGRGLIHRRLRADSPNPSRTTRHTRTAGPWDGSCPRCLGRAVAVQSKGMRGPA